MRFQGGIGHLNRLDQFLFGGVDGIQTVNRMMVLLVRRRIAQCTQRREVLDASFLTRGSYVLGFINNDNGAAATYECNGT